MSSGAMLKDVSAADVVTRKSWYESKNTVQQKSGGIFAGFGGTFDLSGCH